MAEKKKYYIESSHDVFETGHDGDGKAVNFYTLSAILDASDIEQAIKKYCDEVLYFDDYPEAGDWSGAVIVDLQGNQIKYSEDADYPQFSEYYILKVYECTRL